MRAPKMLLSFTAALLIVGAGCDAVPTDTNTNAGSLVLPSQSDASNVNASDSTPAATDTKMDDTWKTYANAALGYSFKWPSVGRYAPKWDASFAKEGDARIKDGCLVAAEGKTDTFSVGDNAFCHTSTESKDGASTTDYYVTKKADQYVVLTFTKTKDALKDFSWSEYHSLLAQIVGTYSTSK
jgi:hypothetical protein